MDLTEYQAEVVRTDATCNEVYTVGLAMAVIGLCGELGEIAEPVKKHLYHKHELRREHLAKELGDMLWYLTLLCDKLDISLQDVLDANVKKLRERYPHGFDSDRSINRVE